MVYDFGLFLEFGIWNLDFMYIDVDGYKIPIFYLPMLMLILIFVTLLSNLEYGMLRNTSSQYNTIDTLLFDPILLNRSIDQLLPG